MAAKICCNKDAPRFPRWLTSTRTAERAWLLKHWERKAGDKIGGKEGILAEQTCLRARIVTHNYCPSTSIALVLQRCWESYITGERGIRKGGKGDDKDCITCSDSAVTFQLPLKPHLTKRGQLNEKTQILKDQRAVSKHLHFLTKAEMKTCPSCTCLLHLTLFHKLWAPVL